MTSLDFRSNDGVLFSTAEMTTIYEVSCEFLYMHEGLPISIVNRVKEIKDIALSLREIDLGHASSIDLNENNSTK